MDRNHDYDDFQVPMQPGEQQETTLKESDVCSAEERFMLLLVAKETGGNIGLVSEAPDISVDGLAREWEQVRNTDAWHVHTLVSLLELLPVPNSQCRAALLQLLLRMALGSNAAGPDLVAHASRVVFHLARGHFMLFQPVLQDTVRASLEAWDTDGGRDLAFAARCLQLMHAVLTHCEGACVQTLLPDMDLSPLMPPARAHVSTPPARDRDLCSLLVRLLAVSLRNHAAPAFAEAVKVLSILAVVHGSSVQAAGEQAAGIVQTLMAVSRHAGPLLCEVILCAVFDACFMCPDLLEVPTLETGLESEPGQEATVCVVDRLADYATGHVGAVQLAAVKGFCRLLLHGAIADPTRIEGYMHMLCELYVAPTTPRHASPLLLPLVHAFFDQYADGGPAKKEILLNTLLYCVLDHMHRGTLRAQSGQLQCMRPWVRREIAMLAAKAAAVTDQACRVLAANISDLFHVTIDPSALHLLLAP